EQDLLQVSAMDDAIGEPVALPIAPGRDRHDRFAADRVDYVNGNRLAGRFSDCRLEAEAGQDATGIRGKLDTGTQLAQLLGALSDQRLEAIGGEGQRRGQSTDAGAGDDDRLPLAHPTPRPGSGGRARVAVEMTGWAGFGRLQVRPVSEE